MDRPPEKPNDETAKLVTAVLKSQPHQRVPLKSFEDAFRQCTGESFPWQEWNYSSPSDCLEAFDRVCAIEKLTVPLMLSGGHREELSVVLKEADSASDKRDKNSPSAEPEGSMSAWSSLSSLSDRGGPRSHVVLTFGIHDNTQLNST